MDLKTFIELKKDIKKNDIEGQKKLYKKARQENLFRVKLSDFIEQLAKSYNLSKNDLTATAEIKVIFPGLNANNSSVLRMFDNSPVAAKQKIMKIKVKSITPNWNFEDIYEVRFNIFFNYLANGQKFRDILDMKKDREKHETIITLKPNNEENLVVDFSHAMLNGQLKSKPLEALYTCIRNKEKETIQTTENTKK
jgi:hypothetical protein